MSILESIRLLYCLNESGIDKAHDLLTELVNDQQHNRVTLEQLFDETDKIIQDAEIKFQKEDEEAKQRKLNERQQLSKDYKDELRMIDNTMVPFMENQDIFKVIDRLNDYSIMKIRNAYAWGYIRGIRTERARRKKVSV